MMSSAWERRTCDAEVDHGWEASHVATWMWGWPHACNSRRHAHTGHAVSAGRAACGALLAEQASAHTMRGRAAASPPSTH